ncbi:hypothetical protein Tco_0808080 [Tanacetum coccineum]
MRLKVDVDLDILRGSLLEAETQDSTSHGDTVIESDGGDIVSRGSRFRTESDVLMSTSTVSKKVELCLVSVMECGGDEILMSHVGRRREKTDVAGKLCAVGVTIGASLRWDSVNDFLSWNDCRYSPRGRALDDYAELTRCIGNLVLFSGIMTARSGSLIQAEYRRQ